MKDINRPAKVARALKKELSIILQREIRDPRIDKLITVTAVEISKDLVNAKVFIIFGYSPDSKKNILKKIKILQNADGYIRTLLSKNICLRIIPKITFLYDQFIAEKSI
ncbi:MAG: 30S ribosome-binding factor RbfA [Candidatus Dasytiphilus stammeri]